MKIAILAPTHKSFIKEFLSKVDTSTLPEGYFGAPFIGTIIYELLLRGHEVTAITTSPAVDNNYEVKKFSTGKFTWIVIPSRPRSIQFNGVRLGRILDFYYLERTLMRRAVIASGVNFIHAHWSYEFAGAAIGSGIPFLVTIHDNPYQVFKYTRNAYRLGRLLMSEWILSKVKFASTVSTYMLPYALKKCQNVEVIPNPTVIRYGVQEVLSLISARISKLQSPKIIMIMNGWDTRKNGIVGLQAFQLLLENFPNATLHLFGKGTEFNGPAYQDGISLSIKNVIYNGGISHNDLLNHLNTTHLLMHTSLEESFGVVLIEAMGCGIPVIGGIDSGAVPWVVANDSLLVSLTARNLSQRITEVLSSKNKYNEISRCCYENTVSRFSAKAVVSQYESYYLKISSDKS